MGKGSGINIQVAPVSPKYFQQSCCGLLRGTPQSVQPYFMNPLVQPVISEHLLGARHEEYTAMLQHIPPQGPRSLEVKRSVCSKVGSPK